MTLPTWEEYMKVTGRPWPWPGVKIEDIPFPPPCKYDPNLKKFVLSYE
jgi:hypothetical protein